MTTLDPSVLPAVSAVHVAAERLRSFLAPSRLVRNDELSVRLGVEVLLKLELENPTGSFKVRGAYNVLAGLSDVERQRGVVASSAGNHGLGVAYAARTFGAPAMLYVPSTAPQVKKDGIRALGAVVNDDAPDYDAAMVLAKAHAERHGIRFINPCLGLDLLAGQGTVGLELLSQCPDMQAVYVCTGGGGLLGGMGAVLRREAPQVRIVGVQSVETHAMTSSVRAGRVVDTVVTPTLADGLAGQIDADALHIGQTCSDAMLLVSEEEIGETIVWFKRTTGLVAEGAGAVTLAALRHGAARLPVPSRDGTNSATTSKSGAHGGGPIVAIVSGRNIDPSRVAQLEAAHAEGPAARD